MRRVAWCAVALLLTLAARGQDGDVLAAYRAAEASGAALLGPVGLLRALCTLVPDELKALVESRVALLEGLSLPSIPHATAGAEPPRRQRSLRRAAAIAPTRSRNPEWHLLVPAWERPA